MTGSVLDASPSDSPVVMDLGRLAQLARDNPDMDEKLHVFIFESSHRLNELNRLYQQKDYPAMLAEILSLRTAASSFGVVSLAFLTHELEIACLKKSNSQIQDLFKFASAELDQAAGIIKAHLVNMKATPSGGQ